MASQNSPTAQLEANWEVLTPEQARDVIPAAIDAHYAEKAKKKSAGRGYKPRKTLKPPAIQSAILAKRANGHSKAKIAKDLEIAVNTVTNVIELNDFDRTLQTEQSASLKLIPRAIQVAHDRLTKGSENMAIKVLENTIWPLNTKTSKQGDPGLTLAIQNLMGNVQVNAQQAQGPSPEPVLEPKEKQS